MNIPVDKCPFCGNDKEFYTKDYIFGSSWFIYNFNDEIESDNSSMYDNLSHKPGKFAYCCKCNRRIFKLEGD